MNQTKIVDIKLWCLHSMCGICGVFARYLTEFANYMHVFMDLPKPKLAKIHLCIKHNTLLSAIRACTQTNTNANTHTHTHTHAHTHTQVIRAINEDNMFLDMPVHLTSHIHTWGAF